jgi:anthraniloyl-CoA monooxygenase
VFETDVESDADYPDADLIIASDGINSRIRTKYADVFKPDIVVRPNRYIWLGTNKLYDAFTFLFEKTEHGWFQAHIYKFDETTTTFIVECPEHVWQAHGWTRRTRTSPSPSAKSCSPKNLQGAKLMTNARHLRGSAWLNFQRVKCEQWSLFNGKSHVVLMGDAVHTAHFAIGSGTKLAIEDAIELTRLFKRDGRHGRAHPRGAGPLPGPAQRGGAALQNAAWNAMEWFEVCGERYCDQLNPSSSCTHAHAQPAHQPREPAPARCAMAGRLRGLVRRAQAGGKPSSPPMLTPWNAARLTLKNRIVVSPMAQYSAVDGVVATTTWCTWAPARWAAPRW